jgi:hypothetical protein
LGGNVPLSEHEQRQLEQIEQALYADYPKLAQAVHARDPRVHYKRRVFEAAVGFIVGIGLLLAGVMFKRFFPWIAVGGFVVMLACAMWALNSWRHMGGAVTGRAAGRGVTGRGGPRRGATGGGRPGGSRRGRAGSSGFMERLEERWRRRQEGER